jgi:drug/metabolite transporter (DMT)-like permease
MNPPSQNISGAMDLSSWLTLLGLAAVWGGSFFFIKIGLEHYHPLTVVALRLGLAALALNIYILLTRQKWPQDRRFWPMILLMGVTNNVIPFLLIVWGETQISGALASVLNATTPLFTVIVANIMTQDERLSAAKILSVLLGFAGVSVIIGPDIFSAGADHHVLAQLGILCASFCYALATTYGRRFKPMGIAPAVIATGQVSVSALMLAPLALILDRPWEQGMPSLHVAGALSALALVSTAAAYIVYFRFVAKNGATNMALVTLLVPVSAIMLGAVFLGEALLPRHFIGMAIIALCFVVLDGRPMALIKRRFLRVFA